MPPEVKLQGDVVKVQRPAAHAVGQFAVLVGHCVLVACCFVKLMRHLAEALLGSLQHRLLKKGHSVTNSDKLAKFFIFV